MQLRQHVGDRLRSSCERGPVAARETSQRDRRSDFSAVDSRRAPQFTKSIDFKFLEEDVRAELIVRFVTSCHGVNPRILVSVEDNTPSATVLASPLPGLL